MSQVCPFLSLYRRYLWVLGRSNVYVHIHCSEPFIKDILNIRHDRNNLWITDKLWCPKYRPPYRANTFLTSKEWTPLYNGRKWLVPKCPLFGSSTVLSKDQNLWFSSFCCLQRGCYNRQDHDGRCWCWINIRNQIIEELVFLGSPPPHNTCSLHLSMRDLNI